MQNIETLTTFFGWMTIINMGLLVFSTVMLLMMKDFVCRVHGRLFQIAPGELKPIYFRYLANFKLLALVFNLAPYIALKMMA